MDSDKRTPRFLSNVDARFESLDLCLDWSTYKSNGSGKESSRGYFNEKRIEHGCYEAGNGNNGTGVQNGSGD